MHNRYPVAREKQRRACERIGALPLLTSARCTRSGPLVSRSCIASTRRLGGDDLAHEVFLVPGFLGYVKLGGFRYFDDSALGALRAALDAKGLRDVRMTVLPTDPTGSLYDRQQLLLGALGERARGADGIHLVGHSTGGVDCWLLLRKRPLGGIAWNDSHGVRKRICSVTTISAPFWGSFLAERVADFGPSLVRKIPVVEPAPRADYALLDGAAPPVRRMARPRHDVLALLLSALHSPLTLGLLARVALNHRLLEDLRPQLLMATEIRRKLPPTS
jgi:pimeloyl-ACP methyl ester carboxylesterase